MFAPEGDGQDPVAALGRRLAEEGAVVGEIPDLPVFHQGIFRRPFQDADPGDGEVLQRRLAPPGIEEEGAFAPGRGGLIGLI